MNDFKNTYVSYSRLSRFEQCPLAFKLHYIDKLKSEPGPPLVFGSAIHLILERLIDEHVKAGKPGPLSKNRAFELLKDVFVEMKITGAELFDDGMSILRRFVANQEIIEPTQVLAIEREFKIQAGAYTVLGYIDRVDRIDNDTVRIIDYKTNRMLFTRNEVDESLQFSIYCIAAKQLWPWAKNILLSFDMLRHGVTLTTTRTDEQLESALAYVETLSRLTEEVNDYPAKLNTNCVYCDHSKLCPVYNEVLQNRKTPDFEELTDIEDIAKEREELAKVAKILYARKKKLDGMIKARLSDQDEVSAAGMNYRMINTQKVSYPLGKALDILVERTDLDREKTAEEISFIDKKAMDKVIKRLSKSMDRSQLNLLKAEISAITEVGYSPRMIAKATSI